MTQHPSPMIATVTLNPALDKTVYISGLVVGDTNRVEKTELDAGGKGVNASRMLAELGTETVALGFVGGRTGRFIESVLSEEGIQTDFVHTRAETRTNVAIQDPDGGKPTTLNERGGPISAEELEELRARVRYWAAKSEIMIFGGSIPRGVEKNIYRELIEIAQIEGARAILDADGEALTLGMLARPMLIKPNEEEAERLCGRDIATVDDAADAAASLVGRGVEIVVVSLGKEGAVAATSDEVWEGVPPEVEAISTVGSGDSMVAGMALAFAQGKQLADALALGSAAGAATAMSSGVEIGKRRDVERVLPQVALRRIR